MITPLCLIHSFTGSAWFCEVVKGDCRPDDAPHMLEYIEVDACTLHDQSKACVDSMRVEVVNKITPITSHLTGMYQRSR